MAPPDTDAAGTPAVFPLNAQELSNVLYALARFGQAPDAHLMGDLLGALQLHMGSAAAAPAEQPSHASAANAGKHVSSSTGADAVSSGTTSTSTRADASSNASSSTPSTSIRSSTSASSVLGAREGGTAVARPLNTQELSNVLWSLAQLGVQPSDSWLADFWAAVQQQIRWGAAGECMQQESVVECRWVQRESACSRRV